MEVEIGKYLAKSEIRFSQISRNRFLNSTIKLIAK